MIYLTIINTIAICFILFKLYANISFSIDKITSFQNDTLLGYRFHINKNRNFEYYTHSIFSFYIPIRNKKKTELAEEVQRMISQYSEQGKRQTLTAKFSWLKTWEQVRQFEKDYSVVDRKIVENLVTNFKPKQ